MYDDGSYHPHHKGPRLRTHQGPLSQQQVSMPLYERYDSAPSDEGPDDQSVITSMDLQDAPSTVREGQGGDKEVSGGGQRVGGEGGGWGVGGADQIMVVPHTYTSSSVNFTGYNVSRWTRPTSARHLLTGRRTRGIAGGSR